MAMSTLTLSGFFWEIFLVQLMTYTDFEKKRWLPLLLAEISNGKIKIESTEIYLWNLKVKLKTRWAIAGSWELLDFVKYKLVLKSFMTVMPAGYCLFVMNINFILYENLLIGNLWTDKIKGENEIYTGLIFFSYFSVNFPPESSRTQSEQVKMTFLKGGVYGFSYFSFIFNYFIFYSDHPSIYFVEYF